MEIVTMMFGFIAFAMLIYYVWILMKGDEQ